ncbi:MAG: hypothetical protein HWQ35_05930 [Nostoc sp. NMS1]|uniref:hypothetical protein n=1 Tax=unclassified Nostoc TaxID=2593658 RepID=UPI002600102A|nr:MULTISPECIES: hypothetical protein [unclassified Nostoc]MBN3906101.1 hypothetical protein [Nostoc sp. NMS1]MBN3991839.1 hypothetical protein [Nostoc sp. NMS2]
MAKIYILDLQSVISSDINTLKNDDLYQLTVQDTTKISGGLGLTPAEGLTFGTALLSGGIGVLAIATGPVGWLSAGFLYGGGLTLATYSGYLVGGGGGGGIRHMLQ